MAINHSGRSRPRRLVVAAIFCALLISPAAAAGDGSGAPADEVDIALFSNRAVAWGQAVLEQRVEALNRAAQLGVEAKEAEEAAEKARLEQERQAAEARAQREAEAAAAAAAALTTTTVVPTTTSTTVAPTTTEGAVEESASTTTTTAADTPGTPTAAQWEALRKCESGGRYDAVSPKGRYRGAYQFSQATWDWVAGTANPALIGVDPAAASPTDQDAQALALWTMRGSGPWPTCGVHLS